jgi:molybdopterin synthase sulfur carrier subunit
MITVNVKFLSLLSELTDMDELWLELRENSTINQLFSELHNKIGMEFERRILSKTNGLNKYIIVAINGIDIRTLDGVDTVIKDRDNVTFLPALAGG